ncbi:MAG: transglutaminase domain-containing protein [Pseudomonadota bacterium]
MRLSIQHKVTYRYVPDAARVAIRLKMFPAVFAAQSMPEWALTVNGQRVEPLLTDAAGDAIALWQSHDPVEDVVVNTQGIVETVDRSGVVDGLSKMMAPPIYLRETKLTEPDDAIREISGFATGATTLDRLHALCGAVREAIIYRQGATEVDTTAAEALARGAGVCQDQAHVFIAAARCLGIPARYVVGYFLDPDGAGESEESHAWAEAYVSGLGWIGFDITNELCPTDRYVRLASGFDAYDAAPVRGTVFGDAEEEMTAEVIVSMASAQSQQ